MTGFTSEQLVTKYIELRDGLDTLEAAHKAKKKVVSDAMEAIGSVLKSLLIESKEISRRTETGTFFTEDVEYISVKAGEWDATLAFILETKLYNMLNKAVNKTATKEFIAEHGTPPPGVKYTVERELRVRRDTSK